MSSETAHGPDGGSLVCLEASTLSALVSECTWSACTGRAERTVTPASFHDGRDDEPSWEMRSSRTAPTSACRITNTSFAARSNVSIAARCHPSRMGSRVRWRPMGRRALWVTGYLWPHSHWQRRLVRRGRADLRQVDCRAGATLTNQLDADSRVGG